MSLRRCLIRAVVAGVLLAVPATANSKALSPRRSLIKAEGSIHALATQASASSVKTSASAAAGELRLATNPELWINGHEADAPSYGALVFSDSAAALRDLKGLPRRQDAATSRLIIRALRGVAAYMIGQARGGNAALLGAARQSLKTGDGRSSGDARINPVSDYRKAWEDAYEALTQLVVAKVTSVPAADVGAAAENALGSQQIGLAGPEIMTGNQPLTAGGKPELFFGGSEACPFCGVERWGMIVALAQFGTFSDLHLMQSLPTEQPSDSTFTFFGSSYQSPYVAFVPVEVWSNVRSGASKKFVFKHLQPLSASEQGLFKQFNPQRITPFIDVGNSYINIDSTVLPQLIDKLSWTQDANSLTQPNSVPAQAISGEAEVITAELCEVTKGTPSSVCASLVVKQYEAALPFLNGQGGGCPPPTASPDRATRDRSRRRQGPLASAAHCGR